MKTQPYVSKLAITGKGGVGKTTLTALLASLWAKDRQVTVVDADPSMNLALALGIPAARREEIIPLTAMKDLIEERTGASGQGGFFKLNPKVDDLAAKLAVCHNDMRLIVMGTITQGGAGCACAENVLLKAFLAHLLLEPQEVVIVDMEAGLEHLGRRTVQAVDALLVVVEPGRRSLEVGMRIKQLAADIGLKRVFFVANKIQTPAESQFIRENLGAEKLLTSLPYTPAILTADREGLPADTVSEGGLKEALQQLKQALEQGVANGAF